MILLSWSTLLRIQPQRDQMIEAEFPDAACLPLSFYAVSHVINSTRHLNPGNLKHVHFQLEQKLQIVTFSNSYVCRISNSTADN
jgi:hypothetical protein